MFNNSNNYDLYKNFSEEYCLRSFQPSHKRNKYGCGYSINQKKITNSLKDMNLTKKKLNNAQLFHGSTSASLLSFTKYNNYQGKLIPTGQLMKLGKIPFTGELKHGITNPRGISHIAISTTDITHIDTSLNYTICGLDVTEEEYLDSLSQKKNIISNIRLIEFNKLDKLEKYLVLHQFPVLYGIKLKDEYDENNGDNKDNENQRYTNSMSKKNKRYIQVNSIIYEIGIKNGISKDEIKIIFVEKRKIKLVQQIVGTDIIVKRFTKRMTEIINKRSSDYILKDSILNSLENSNEVFNNIYINNNFYDINDIYLKIFYSLKNNKFNNINIHDYIIKFIPKLDEIKKNNIKILLLKIIIKNFGIFIMYKKTFTKKYIYSHIIEYINILKLNIINIKNIKDFFIENLNFNIRSFDDNILDIIDEYINLYDLSPLRDLFDSLKKLNKINYQLKFDNLIKNKNLSDNTLAKILLKNEIYYYFIDYYNLFKTNIKSNIEINRKKLIYIINILNEFRLSLNITKYEINNFIEEKLNITSNKKDYIEIYINLYKDNIRKNCRYKIKLNKYYIKHKK